MIKTNKIKIVFDEELKRTNINLLLIIVSSTFLFFFLIYFSIINFWFNFSVIFFYLILLTIRFLKFRAEQRELINYFDGNSENKLFLKKIFSWNNYRLNLNFYIYFRYVSISLFFFTISLILFLTKSVSANEFFSFLILTLFLNLVFIYFYIFDKITNKIVYWFCLSIDYELDYYEYKKVKQDIKKNFVIKIKVFFYFISIIHFKKGVLLLSKKQKSENE